MLNLTVIYTEGYNKHYVVTAFWLLAGFNVVLEAGFSVGLEAGINAGLEAGVNVELFVGAFVLEFPCVSKNKEVIFPICVGLLNIFMFPTFVSL